MKVIYDTEKLVLERCQVIADDGTAYPAGAFWLQVAITDVERRVERELLNIKRWGDERKRQTIHRAATEVTP